LLDWFIGDDRTEAYTPSKEHSMKTISDLDAQSDLARVLAEVADGETFVITVEGAPVARVSPVGGSVGRPVPPPSDAAVDALHRFRREQKISLGGLSIRDLIEDGRRY
jgi:prevent-host-death family protein